MSRLILHHWLNRLARPSPRARRRTDPLTRQRSRLVLESLEGRCVPTTVTNLNEAGDGSLRQAIIDTPAGGTVDFQAGLSGTITLMTGELEIAKNLSIDGPGANVITVSGNYASRVFDISASLTVAISGLTIANGSAPLGEGGGGIYNNFGSLTVTASTLSGNSTAGFSGAGGAGIFNNAGTLTVTASTLSGNFTSTGNGSNDGGGIYTAMGTVTVIDSTFNVNSAEDGGGIFNNAGTLTVTGSTLSGNSGINAPDGGGGISNYYGTVTVSDSTLNGNSDRLGGGIGTYDGAVTVSDSTLNGNSAGVGGGISNISGIVTVSDSTLNGNSATYGGGIYNDTAWLTVGTSTVSSNSATYGGGIFNNAQGTVTLTSSTLSGNSVPNGSGGGIYDDSGSTVTVTESTLSGNSAGTSGGGIFINVSGLVTSTVTVTDSTLRSNSAGTSGGGICNNYPSITASKNTILAGNTAPGSPDMSGPLSSQGHNLIGEATGGSGYDPTDLVGTSSNPIDPKLGPLQDNGGPTATMALLPTSPAIAAGDPTDATEWDQRGPGYPRVVNGITDIGAFQVQTTLVFPVTNSKDDGAGSLRQAILDANAASGFNVITFNIPGSGAPTISPTSELPALTVPVFIDGITQPGFAGAPMVVVNGTQAGAGANGLTLTGGGSIVRGLAVNGFDGAGILLQGNGGDLVTGDYIGTDAAGTTALGNGVGVSIADLSGGIVGFSQTTAASRNVISGNIQDGVIISGNDSVVAGNRIGTDVTGSTALANGTGIAVIYIGSNNMIGGPASWAGNLISGNVKDGVGIYGGSGNTIQGNFIGTDATGLIALPNGYGVELYSGSYNSVGGGSAAGAGNLISGNIYDGIGIYSDGNTAQGNRIGTDASGLAPLGNGGDGVAIQAFLHGYDNAIGGTDSGAGNTIAYNGGYGVRITGGTGEAIHQNAIYANGAGGIFLLNGGNQDEPAPELTSAVAGVDTVTVIGTVAGTPGAELVVEFFANTVCDPSGYGQGERFLGSTTVVVGPDGEASFTAIVDGTVDVGQFITATASDPAGNTSQFSNCVEVTGMDIAAGGLNRVGLISESATRLATGIGSGNSRAANAAPLSPGDLRGNNAIPSEATIPTMPVAMMSRAQDAVFEAWDTLADGLAGN
jgi:hypothetical protein